MYRRVGKAYAISDIIHASYFYPLGAWTDHGKAPHTSLTGTPPVGENQSVAEISRARRTEGRSDAVQTAFEGRRDDGVGIVVRSESPLLSGRGYYPLRLYSYPAGGTENSWAALTSSRRHRPLAPISPCTIFTLAKLTLSFPGLIVCHLIPSLSLTSWTHGRYVN